MTASLDPDDLAAHRRRARRYVQHLDFLADTFVDQALVKMALLGGLSQSDTAKMLGMSKKTVNQHSRRPFTQYAVATGMDITDVGHAFYRHVWGSDTAAAEAFAACRRYDRERLHIETP